MKNLYAVLGVPPSSTEDTIKKAYRELARAKHPDAGGDTKVFAEITHAGSVLLDRDRRHEHDQKLRILLEPCPECDGQGVTYVYTSFTESAQRRCASCQGEGYHARRP